MRLLLFLLIFAILIRLTVSEVLEMDFIFYKNNTIKLERIKLNFGEPSILWEGDYFLFLKDLENKTFFNISFHVAFLLLTDPPKEINEKPVVIKIEYKKEYPRNFILEIYKKDKKIFSEIISLCNENNICENYESYLSCPQDCKLNQKDDICIALKDNICDPDCFENADPDCQKMQKPICLNIKDGYCEIECPEDPDCKLETSAKFLPIVLLTIILLVIIFLFIAFIKKPKKRND